VLCNDSFAIDDPHDTRFVEMPARSSGDRGQIGGAAWRLAATGPSPLPDTPWQEAQCRS
jgi:hypothetical protein